MIRDGDFGDWLAWLTVHQRWMTHLTFVTEGGGLAVDGYSLFDEVKQRGDVIGLELAGLKWWFQEADVYGVKIAEDGDVLMFYVRDQASFILRPVFAQGADVVI